MVSYTNEGTQAKRIWKRDPERKLYINVVKGFFTASLQEEPINIVIPTTDIGLK